MQGDTDPGGLLDSGHSPHTEYTAPGPAFPGPAQQHRALPAHCAGLLPCQRLDQWTPGEHALASHQPLIFWLGVCGLLPAPCVWVGRLQ